MLSSVGNGMAFWPAMFDVRYWLPGRAKTPFVMAAIPRFEPGRYDDAGPRQRGWPYVCSGDSSLHCLFSYRFFMDGEMVDCLSFVVRVLPPKGWKPPGLWPIA